MVALGAVAPAALATRNGISANEVTPAPSSNQAVASKPTLRPQYGSTRLAAKLRTSSLTPCVNGKPAKTSSMSHKRITACGMANSAFSASSNTPGRAAGLAPSIRARVKRCRRSAMAALSRLLRTISICCCSRLRILSRSISI